MGVSCIFDSIAGKMGRFKLLNPIYGIVIVLMELSKATTSIAFP